MSLSGETMDLLVSSWTQTRYGASSLFGPIRDRLEIELGEYGTALEKIHVDIVLPESQGGLTQEEQQEYENLPRIKLLRKSKKIKVACLSECVTATDETQDYSVKKINQVLPDVLRAFRMVNEAMTPKDDWNCEAFERDFTRLLTKNFKSLKEIKKNELRLHEAREKACRHEFQQWLASPVLDKKIHTFILDIPKETASRFADDTVVYINQFALIGDWFETYLRKEKISGALQQLTIRFDENGIQGHAAPALIEWPFDFEKFESHCSAQKKKMIAVAMRDALLWFVKFHELVDKEEPIRNAFNAMLQEQFVRKATLKKRVTGSQFVAIFNVLHELDGIEITVSFSKPRSRTILGTVSLGKCPYHPWLLGELHRFASWKGTQLTIDIPHISWKQSVDVKGLSRPGL